MKRVLLIGIQIVMDPWTLRRIDPNIQKILPGPVATEMDNLLDA